MPTVMFYLPTEFWERNLEEMLRLSLELCDALLGLPVNTQFTHRGLILQLASLILVSLQGQRRTLYGPSKVSTVQTVRYRKLL